VHSFGHIVKEPLDALPECPLRPQSGPLLNLTQSREESSIQISGALANHLRFDPKPVFGGRDRTLFHESFKDASDRLGILGAHVRIQLVDFLAI